ncbi:succinylglutamate desuccinylase/aspartoacylase family protein [Phaeodactylibacter luteus]|uniref:Succinylglutamate desuccinylase/aspartoacylase family protein n=1 Tax=Phaeodactylibacter luteus TaxID=1564516 RepID=A0A5C6RHI4_9BACT|nr:succinylglutamate desuccinylase/aspartoacylase family protein [Phaeodactylibacter luteus]TXB61617.1 succinylglutamate desuccinylase/aspartoacylase family protein [Phaeodactylibacter luteus]
MKDIFWSEKGESLDIGAVQPGEKKRFWLPVVQDGIGMPVRLPVMVARGKEPGPVLGLTAALHGNELNGIPVIQQLFREIDCEQLKGTVVGVLVMNVPGLMLQQRKFNDGVDLNRIAPGQADGNVSEVYAHRLIDRILRHFDYLVDLHTASAGRINSWYIRADMSQEATARMAILQNPDIILHNPPNDTTFRGAAARRGIHAITLELKDPHVFQNDVIEDGLIGIRNILYDLQMLPGAITWSAAETILCRYSQWIYTDEGGILHVLPQLGQTVGKGDRIAEVRSIFDEVEKVYWAPYDGVVIGRSISPINPTGSRILHLGGDPQVVPCALEGLPLISS